jgi:hypothetical protein
MLVPTELREQLYSWESPAPLLQPEDTQADI